jgi:hypothetical protein
VVLGRACGPRARPRASLRFACRGRAAFRYLAGEPRELDIEVSPPSRVRVKVEVSRERDGQVLAEAVAAKAHQTVRILGFACSAGPILIRLSQGKHDGNASEPYLLKVVSRLAQRDAGR